MTDAAATGRRGPGHRAVWITWALLSALLLAAAWVDAPRLGLYYDEAFLAQQARDFVEPGRPSQHPGSVRSVEIAGRPFPTFNAAYLGALKSQLVMPAFALFGASPRVLRVATCATALVALLFALLWLEQLFGPWVAVVTALLVATDPAFFFFSQFEWGPFTTNLLCRSVGAWALWIAWTRTGRASWLAASLAGLAFGLGIYSRADFALILAAAGGALLVFRRDLVWEALRTRRVALGLGLALLLLASAPMWTRASALLSTGEAIADRGDLAERMALLESTLDGTRFARLMEAGGVFERALDAPVASGAAPEAEVDTSAGVERAAGVEPTALLGCALGAFVLLAFETVRRRRTDGPSPALSTRAWLLATTLGVTLAMLALPGAVRAHHQLNVLPLWHAVIAVAVVDLFGRAWRTPRHARVARLALAAVVGLVVAGQLAALVQTRRFIHDTGGRGRWSLALNDLARRLDRTAGEAVSLDWGFHENLLFLTRRARLREAIWDVPVALRSGRAWGHRGDADTVYLVHDERYDLFGIGPRLLAFAGADREGGPGSEAERAPGARSKSGESRRSGESGESRRSGESGKSGESGTNSEGSESGALVEAHLDGEGRPAFYTVRIPRPHVLVFDGSFRVQ